MTVRPGVSPGETNALPFPVGTTSLHPGYLHYRVYLPAGGDLTGIKLPTISVTKGFEEPHLAVVSHPRTSAGGREVTWRDAPVLATDDPAP